jgi:pimeloyl-ACP methyl ester carboxylesterase
MGVRGQVHGGFSGVALLTYEAIEGDILRRAPTKGVVITGHSLGGAVAKLLAAMFQVMIIRVMVFMMIDSIIRDDDDDHSPPTRTVAQLIQHPCGEILRIMRFWSVLATALLPPFTRQPRHPSIPVSVVSFAGPNVGNREYAEWYVI